MTTFIGVDLGWYGKPTGLASIRLDDSGLYLHNIARVEDVDQILEWVVEQAKRADAVVGVDAPLVITNATGIRGAERGLNAVYRKFHAGCHAANLGRPFAGNVVSFSQRLEALGFAHGAALVARQPGRFQIEVHPHAATVSLFQLDRIVKYKRGTRQEKARGLRRLRSLMLTRLPLLDPPLSLTLPSLPRTGPLKPVEDQIDAVMCAYIAAHWWHWGLRRNQVYGDNENGYIVVPGSR